MRTLLLCVCLTGLGLPANAQIIHYPLQGSSPAWLIPALPESDPIQAAMNPSLLASVRHFAGGLSSIRPFGLPGHYVSQAGLLSPLPGAGAGLEISHATGEGFAETRISLACGKKLGAVDLGLTLGYYHLRFEGYGSAGTLLTGVGFHWKLTGGLGLGGALFNPAGGYLGSRKQEKVPVSTVLTVDFRFSEILALTLAARGEEGRSPDFQPALQYRPARELIFEAGIHSAGWTSWIRSGWQKESWQVLLLLAFHPRLGASPGLQLAFVLPDKK